MPVLPATPTVISQLVHFNNYGSYCVGDSCRSNVDSMLVMCPGCLLVGVFALCVLVLVCLTFAIHIYIFVYETTWQQALRDYLV